MNNQSYVAPKKHLGQHFLRDERIAARIAESLKADTGYKTLIEIGPGTGMLTRHLLHDRRLSLYVIELDTESVHFLEKNIPELQNKIIEKDFLEFDPTWLPVEIQNEPFGLIGNFPYNISSQILFKILEFRNQIPEMVGMFQKEVAQRVAARPGSKTYGILSVLLQAYYTIEYLFTVHENVFIPPPKVKSGVIRLTRNSVRHLSCNEELFFQVVKAGFNQRRKTLRNSLGARFDQLPRTSDLLKKRAEQLSVEDFVRLTNEVEQAKKD